MGATRWALLTAGAHRWWTEDMLKCTRNYFGRAGGEAMGCLLTHDVEHSEAASHSGPDRRHFAVGRRPEVCRARMIFVLFYDKQNHNPR